MEYKIKGGFEWKTIYTEKKKSVRGKGDPSTESSCSDQTLLLSKLFLGREPRCGWIQNQP